MTEVTKEIIAARKSVKTDKASIVAMIRNVRKSYETVRERVQLAGLAIMNHAKETGDCDLARSLIWAMPPHQRAGVIGWFMAYSPIGVLEGKTEADTKARFIRKESKLYHDFDIPAATLHNWWDWMDQNIEREKTLLGAADFFGNLEKMLQKAIKDAKEGRGKTGEDVYQADSITDVVTGAEAILGSVRAFRQAQLAAKAAQQPAAVTIDIGKDGQTEVKDDGVPANAVTREAA